MSDIKHLNSTNMTIVLNIFMDTDCFKECQHGHKETGKISHFFLSDMGDVFIEASCSFYRHRI